MAANTRVCLGASALSVAAVLTLTASYQGGQSPVTGSTSGKPARKASTYEVVQGWPVLPEGFMFGHVTGVGVDSRNQVFVFHRADHSILGKTFDEPISSPVVTCFDGKTGELVASWGRTCF
jgi:hypothetical protein